MIPLQDAQRKILDAISVLRPKAIPLRDALNLTTSVPISSYEDVPPFDNTAVDGFALIASDTQGATSTSPVKLRVIGTIAAGATAHQPLKGGEAYRIMTGAMIPPGANAVVMVEDTDAQGRPEAESVEVYRQVSETSNIRRRGSDLKSGSTLFPAGVTINPATIGVLASLGLAKVPVYPKVRVGVISTGSELTEDIILADGMIRDSNRPSLLATLSNFGAEPIDLGLVPDDHDTLFAAFENAAATCDAVLTSGGVSVGDFDLSKVVLDELSGGKMSWMQIAIRPAKPFAFGVVNDTPIFGLPGNPVSALVSFELLAAPALRKMMGQQSLLRDPLNGIAIDTFEDSPDGRTQYIRGIGTSKDGVLQVSSAGGQGSHVLSAMALANCLVVIPPGRPAAIGDSVSVLPLHNFELP